MNAREMKWGLYGGVTGGSMIGQPRSRASGRRRPPPGWGGRLRRVEGGRPLAAGRIAATRPGGSVSPALTSYRAIVFAGRSAKGATNVMDR